MRIITETSLENFEAWSGGRDTLDTLIEKDLCERLEYHIKNDIFPDGCTDTELNDFLWFEDDFIAELLGYRNWEDLENDREDEEEEGEEINNEYLEEAIENEVNFETYCDNADCDTCPFNKPCFTQDECEKAYNMMMKGYDFEESINK